MKPIITLVLGAALLAACAPTREAARRDLDRTDYHFLRYESIRTISQQVVQQRGLNPGDVVMLMPLEHQKETTHSIQEYDDALIAGLVRSGVKVVRMTEKQFFYTSYMKVISQASGTASVGPSEAKSEYNSSRRLEDNLYVDEADLVRSIKQLRDVGVSKVLCYRWIFSNPRGSGYSDQKYEHTLRFPADRAFFKVVDTNNGQIIWANMLTATR